MVVTGRRVPVYDLKRHGAAEAVQDYPSPPGSPVRVGGSNVFEVEVAVVEVVDGRVAIHNLERCTSADIPGRGRFWRVRIGPFDSKWEAQAYREKFEEQERMNTFVVRRRD